MKPLFLALALFAGFLLVRQTLTMQAQVAPLVPAAPNSAVAEARGRRVAAIEAQDQVLALRQQALENELEHAAESARRVGSRMEQAAVSGPDGSEPTPETSELATQQTQLIEGRREARLELDRVIAERHRLSEEWTRLTGIQNSR